MDKAKLPRTFWSLLVSSAGSNLADGIVKLGVPLIAASLTRDPFLVGLIGTAAGLPWLVAALPAGVIVDRVDRRRAMIVANAVRVVSLLALVLLLAVRGLDIWTLGIIVFVLGLAEVLYDTSAQTILPGIVAKKDLTKANSRLYAAELTTNTFIGPPLAGLLAGVSLVVMAGAPALLWIGALFFLFAIKGKFTAEDSEPTPDEEGAEAPAEHPPRRSMWSQLGEGLSYLWSNSVLRTLAILTGVSNLASNATFAVFVLFAVGPDSEMKLNSVGFGVLMTAFAVGALAGALVADRVVPLIGRTGVFVFTILVFPIQLGMPAITNSPWIIGASLVLGGFAVALWNVTAVSLRQEIVPARLLGRLNSAYRLLAWGSNPLGAFLGGVVAQAFGFTVLFASAGGFALLLVLLLPGVRRSKIDPLLDQ